MINKKNQNGIGLVEILVALLILALGALGFIALQYRAVEATAESGNRIQAVSIARDLAERIRVNKLVFNKYLSEIQVPANQKNYAVNCRLLNCSQNNLADYDVAEVTQKAASLGMTMNILQCPSNVSSLNCIYVAWGDTSATNGNGVSDCMNGTAYNDVSTCLIMETY
ncbi:type IV pilus modification protein PilV [Acinetobacter defluvii]|uniref:type IV pilus modification protein PilV n=1 Tax=Acinetobacter defluvii TaxID=1871111 RepID=UPI003AF57C2F